MRRSIAENLDAGSMQRATTPEWCEQTIKHWFAPLAAEMSLELVRVSNERFEIVSEHLTLRIWFGKPPYRDCDAQETCSVTLVPTKERRAKWVDANNEIGIAVIATYFGEPCRGDYVRNRGEFWMEAEKSALLARKYCRELLLGKSDQYAGIRAYLDAEQRRASAEIRAMLLELGPNVKRMWRMEGESDADWLARVKRGEETPMPPE